MKLFTLVADLTLNTAGFVNQVRNAEREGRGLANALGGQKFSTARVAISYRKSVSTEVDSEAVAKKWCRKKITYTPDKTAIKEALLSGLKIKGCRLVEKQNIQIK